MQAKWGTYAFPVNAAEVTNLTSVSAMSELGLPLRYKTSYHVNVVLDGTSQEDLSVTENALRAALARPHQDFVLFTDSGKPSSSSIFSKLSASGTTVSSVAFPEAQGGEYVNRRTCVFVVEAEYIIANAANAIVSFQETVTIQGNGGPLKRWRYPINAPALIQIISPYSPVIAVQAGRAVGHTSRPVRPAPIWSNLYLMNDTDTRGSSSPKLLGNVYVDFAVEWSYRFERGDGPLIGVANLPPGL